MPIHGKPTAKKLCRSLFTSINLMHLQLFAQEVVAVDASFVLEAQTKIPQPKDKKLRERLVTFDLPGL